MIGRSKQSLKTSLLRILIPFLLLYSGVLIVCSISLPWYRARKLGENWAASATRIAQDQLRDLELRTDETFKYINPHHGSDQQLSEILKENETLAVFIFNRPVRIFPPTEWSHVGIFESIHHSGYLRIGDQLAYASDHGNFHGMGHVVLVHYLDRSVAERIAEVVGHDVTIFAGNTPSASSWRDAAGKPVFPSMDRRTREFLGKSSNAGFPPRIARYRVNGRGGFQVFQGFVPIQGTERQTLGFISVAIPENKVTGTSGKTIVWTLLLLFLLCIGAIALAVKYQERLVGPLTQVTGQIKALAEQIHLRYANVLPPHTGGKPVPPSHNEIDILESAVEAFKHELELSDQLSARIEEEKARTLAASKLVELGRIAAGIMHEINTPLTVINCRATQLLRLSSPDEADSELIRIAQSIEDSVMRISTIAANVRTFARDSVQEELVLTSLKSLVGEVLEFYRDSIRQTSIRWNLVWMAGEAQALIRPVQMSQVIVNLLNNARDAVSETRDPWITISCSERDGMAVLSVTDSGPGIERRLRAKLMTPFFTTKPVGKGTGLGLSISKSIIESHHGHIELDENSPNTRFVVSIPLHTSAGNHVSSERVPDNFRTFT